ncbi:ATP-binding protein [Streptomyces albus]|uniref:ATP-binding protein n=1 Tax=Streptomyces sp. NRRL F-5639 TaxID=1463867 RepID=UPI00068A72EF|nr:ATP-binding protein [Streptomyces sp. NRRL F-5639]
MEQPEDLDRTTAGHTPDGPGEENGSAFRVDIHGNATGPVIAGHHNVVVDAHHGSTVTLLMEGRRPRPVRRDRVALLPGRRRPPLGRERELAALADALAAGGPVQLWGPAGVGKSTLLRHAARTLPPGPDGVLYLSAAHRETGDLAQEIFEACYDTTGYLPSATELRRLMTGVRITVYVDGAGGDADRLRELMDAAPDATFVFAGRNRALLGEGTSLGLKGLETAAAQALLESELGSRLAGHERAAAELCAAAAGAPLLLLRAAALAREDGTGGLVLPRPGTTAELLPLLLDQLDSEPLRVLGLLATLGEADLAPGHIGALAGVPDPSAVCGRLAGLGLLAATDTGYRCTADAVGPLRQRFPAPFPAERLCVHLAEWAALPDTPPARVAEHAPALDAALDLAEGAGRPDLAVRVARAAAPALARALRFDAWGRMLDRGRAAAERAGDAGSVAYFTHEQGVRSLVTGRRVVAGVLLAEAVVLWRQLGDQQGADAAAGAQQFAPPAPADGGASAPGDLGPGDGANTPSPDGVADPGPATDPGTTASSPDAGLSTDPGTTAHAPTTDPGTTAHAPATDPGTAAGPGTTGHSPAPDPGATAHSPAPDTGTAPDAGSAAHGSVPDGGLSSGSQSGASGHPVSHDGGFAHQPGGGSGPVPDASGTAVPPPAGGESAGLAGSTAGGTQAGAAAGGAATAGGASVATTVMTVLAVAAAVTIGGVALKNHQESQEREATPTVTDLARGRSTPSPAATGLAGTWQDSRGGMYTFREAGPGVYTVTGRSMCGEVLTTRFTQRGSGYYATQPLYDVNGGSCGRRLGYVDTTITILPGGSTARLVTALPSDAGQVRCYSCGSSTLTRRS